jgi:uncharacterized protein YegJ (DUF2314 family)
MCHFMTRHILHFIIIFQLVSCQSKMDKIERPDEPVIYQISREDMEMNDAIKKAQNTLNNFTSAFQSKDLNLSRFFVKVRFSNSEAVEHIWVKLISTDNNKLLGIIDNLPNDIQTVEPGDTINIDISKISDWMYTDSVNHKIYGGQTIRVLRSRMTADERTELDEALNGTLK